MHRTGSKALAVAWILLAVAYSTPLWLRHFVSIDAPVTVEPASLEPFLSVLTVAAAALPPLLLAVLTWWWVRGQRGA